MMKKLVGLALLSGCIMWIPLRSQTHTPVKYEPVYQIPLVHKPYQPSDEVRELHIYTSWALGEFTTEDGERITNFELRYELLNEWLEIKVDGEIKLLPLEELREFTWVTPASQMLEHYIAQTTYRYKGLPVEGIYKVLYEGKVKLLEKIEAKLIKPNYIPQLDAGNREYTYERSRTMYLERKGELKLFPKRKKDILRLFTPYYDEMKQFIKKEKLNVRDRKNLIQIVMHYDDLIK